MINAYTDLFDTTALRCPPTFYSSLSLNLYNTEQLLSTQRSPIGLPKSAFRSL
jgi:hypothetical protein